MTVLLVLFGVSSLMGQLTKTFRTQLPVNGDNYTVTFVQRYTKGGVSEGPGGVLQLKAVGKVFLKIEQFEVTGPDLAVIDQIGARVDLPQTLGGASIFLNKSSTGGRSSAILIDKTQQLVASTKVAIIYQNAREKLVPIDLGRNFEIVAPEPAPKNDVA
ncbi:MAG: hypothetical protein AAGA62_17890, partial [Bacteroidota bacterium]